MVVDGGAVKECGCTFLAREAEQRGTRHKSETIDPRHTWLR